MTPAQQATHNLWVPKFSKLMGAPEKDLGHFVCWRSPRLYLSLDIWDEGGGECVTIHHLEPIGSDRMDTRYFGKRHVNLKTLLDALKRYKEKTP